MTNHLLPAEKHSWVTSSSRVGELDSLSVGSLEGANEC
jgi:hypothetical protein